MSDSTNIIQNQIGVSSECLFKIKASAAPCRSVKCNIPASNASTFVGGSTSFFSIPCGRRSTFLDQNGLYLKFCVFNPDTNNAIGFVDNTAYSFINRIDILQGSQQLETIQGANIYQNYLVDMQLLSSSKSGLFPYGCMNQTYPGEGRKGASLLGQRKMMFCVPLIGSALLNNLDTVIPLHSLSDDIIVQITWENNALGFVYAAAPIAPWVITSPELCLSIIEMGDQALQIINNLTPLNEQIILHGSSVKHSIGNIPAASSGSFSFLLPFRFFSIRNIVALPRRSDTTNNPFGYSISSRINPNWASYYLRIGSYNYPQRPIRLWSSIGNVGNYSEAMIENIRSFHSIGSLIGTGLTTIEFNVADTADAVSNVLGVVNATTQIIASTTYANGFCAALELESYSNRNSVILSGMNCVSCNMFFEGDYSSVTGANSYIVDFYCVHDIVFIIENGLITTKY